MKKTLIYNQKMSHYDNIYKFEAVGNRASGYYVGIIHTRGKYPQRYLLIRQNTGELLIKLHAQIEDMAGVLQRGDYLSITLSEIVHSGDNAGQKFYKFDIEVYTQGEDNGETEEAPF